MAGRKPKRSPIAPWQPLLSWVCSYPLLLVEAVLLLAVVWEKLGTSLGIPYLFWHDDPLTQLAAGFGAAVFLGELAFIGFLLDAEELWMREPRQRSLRWYLAVTWLPLSLLLVVPAAFNISRRWFLATGVLCGILVSIAIGVLLERIAHWYAGRRKLKRLSDPEPRRRRFLRRMPEDPSQHFVAMMFFAATAMVYLSLIFLRQWIPISPALAICVILGLFAAGYGFVMFHFPRRHFGVLLALVALGELLTSLGQYKHRIPTLEDAYDDPPRLADYDPKSEVGDALLDNTATLDAWRNRQPQEGKPWLTVVVVSGGGLRSTVWTAGILTAIEQRLPQFPYSVRLVTGASGGMLAAANYVATLAPPETGGHVLGGISLPQNDLVDDLTQESLTPVMRQFVLHDFPRMFLPYNTHSRGVTLEQTWEQHTRGALAIPFRRLAEGEREGWRPSLVFTPTLVEDGRQLVISNLDLSSVVVGDQGISGVEFFRLYPNADEFRLSTATRLSASFPYISPAADLPTVPRRRVVDSAFIDNYGVHFAATWLREHRAWIREHVRGILLIQIRDARITDKVDEPDDSPGLRGLESITSPIEGLVNSRRAIIRYRNDEHVEELKATFNETNPRFFQTLVFESKSKAGLSWYLTPGEIDSLMFELKQPETTNELKRLAEIWSNPTQPKP